MTTRVDHVVINHRGHRAHRTKSAVLLGELGDRGGSTIRRLKLTDDVIEMGFVISVAFVVD